jgi:hypothetical protein
VSPKSFIAFSKSSAGYFASVNYLVNSSIT